MIHQTVRIGRLVAGVLLLVVGLILMLPGVPGPGTLVVFGGLTMLSVEFHWARRLRDGMRNTLERVTGRRHGTR
jgi:uncharacterized protein (TIGR02611 family)